MTNFIIIIFFCCLSKVCVSQTATTSEVLQKKITPAEKKINNLISSTWTVKNVKSMSIKTFYDVIERQWDYLENLQKIDSLNKIQNGIKAKENRKTSFPTKRQIGGNAITIANKIQ